VSLWHSPHCFLFFLPLQLFQSLLYLPHHSSPLLSLSLLIRMRQSAHNIQSWDKSLILWCDDYIIKMSFTLFSVYTYIDLSNYWNMPTDYFGISLVYVDFSTFCLTFYTWNAELNDHFQAFHCVYFSICLPGFGKAHSSTLLMIKSGI